MKYRGVYNSASVPPRECDNLNLHLWDGIGGKEIMLSSWIITSQRAGESNIAFKTINFKL